MELEIERNQCYDEVLHRAMGQMSTLHSTYKISTASDTLQTATGELQVRLQEEAFEHLVDPDGSSSRL